MYVHDPGPKKSYDDGVIYIRTRYVVSKTDIDKEVKEKLLQDIVVRYIIRSLDQLFLRFSCPRPYPKTVHTLLPMLKHS